MEGFLSSSERSHLERLQKREKSRDCLDRIRSVLLKDRGWSSQKIAEALFIHQTTVDAHIREYKSDAKLSSAYKGGSCKLSEEQTLELIAHLQSQLYMHVKEIVSYVLETYSVSYTVRGFTNWLHRHGFSYKKPKKVPYKADPQAQKEFVRHYEEVEKEAALNDEPVFFLDSVHPSQESSVHYGWIFRGTDKLVPSHGGRKRMNFCGALNLADMSLVTEHYETINKENVILFLTKLRKLYPPGVRIHLILDQAGYHIANAVKEFAKNQKIVLHYLPAHSPNLNAIERLWKHMKEKVIYNKFYKDFSTFKKALLAFFEVTYPQEKWRLTSLLTDNFRIVTQAI